MYHRKLQLKALVTVALIGLAGQVHSAVNYYNPLDDVDQSHADPTPIVIDLNDHFSSGFGPISYELSNSNPTVAVADCDGPCAGSVISISMVLGEVGTASFEVTADDGDEDETASFTVTATNAAPIVFPPGEFDFVGPADPSMVEDNGNVIFPGSALFLSAGLGDTNDTLTYSVSFIGETVFLPSIDPVSGQLDLVQVLDANGVQRVTVTATDLAGDSSSSDLVFDIAPLPDAPQITGAVPLQEMDEDELPRYINFGGLFTDIDLAYEGDGPFTTVVQSNTNPSLVNPVPAVGGVTLALIPNAFGVASIDLRIQDSYGEVSDIFTIDLEVTEVNDEVEAVGTIPTQSATEDQGTIDVIIPAGTFEDDDGPDGHVLEVIAISDTSVLTSATSVAGLTGTIEFGLADNENGTVSVTVEARDDDGSNDSVTFDIEIAPQNDLPFLDGDVEDVGMDEDQSPLVVEVLSEFDDIDFTIGDAIDSHLPIVVGNDNPGLVTVTPSGSGVELTLVADQSGEANITVGVRDEGGAEATDSFTLTVDPVNDDVQAVGSIPTQAASEDQGTIDVVIPAGTFTDVDGADSHVLEVITISDTSVLTGATTVPALAGTIEFTLAPNENGTVSVTVEARDNEGSSDTVSFDIEIAPLNDPPFLDGDVADVSMEEDEGSITVDVLGEFDDIDFTVGSQPDNHEPIVVANNNPTLVTVTPSGSGVELTLAPEESGVAVIEVGARDESGAEATDTFTLTVAPKNDPVELVGSIDDRVLSEDASRVSVALTDVFEDLDLMYEGDSHTVTVVGNTDADLVIPVAATLPDLDPTFEFDIAPDLDGTSTITLEAQDLAGTTAQVSFEIEVLPVNDPPFVNEPIEDQTALEDGGDLSIDLTDVFGDADLDEQGDVQFFDVTVGNTTLVTSASVSGTTLTLGFGEHQNGTTAVSVEVTDKEDETAVDEFQLTVTPVNDPPTLEEPIGAIGVNEDAPPTAINLADVFADVDIETNADVLSYTIVTNSDPALFADISFTGDILTLEYAENGFGSATLVVEARDLAGDTVTDTFTVNISEIFPTTADDSATMDEDGEPLVIDVLANDFLGEEPTTIVSLGQDWPIDDPVLFDVTSSEPTTIIDEAGIAVTEPNGTLAVVDGKIVYTPKANFNGSDYFEYTIQDADGDTATARVDITVVAQDDAPRAFTVPNYTVNQGSFLDIQPEGGLLAYAVDDDGDPLEVRLISVPSQAQPGGFELDPSGDGSFVYTPVATYGSVPGQTDSFQIYYWDEADGLASETVTVIINFDPDEGTVAEAPPGEVEFDFDLADVPLEDAVASEANVLVMMDDSGSMDWGVMTPESGGEFRISNSATRNSGVSSYSRTFRYVVQLSTNIYGGDRNVPTEETLAADADFAGNRYGVWRARSAAYSTIYYNPLIHYTPWTGLDRDGNEFEDVNPQAAPLDPFDATIQTIDLTQPVSFDSDRVPATTQRRKNITNSNVYLPYYYDTTATGSPDWDATKAKIIIDNDPATPIVTAAGATLTYFPGGPDRVDCAQDADEDPLTCDYATELQNFANWFSYYRSREYSSKAALGRAIAGASNIRMGYAVLNNSNERERISSLNASYRVGHKKDMMDQVYKIVSNGSTPLRRALDRAGRHFECVSGDAFGSTSSSSPGDSNCPILASPEGQCQNNFTLLFSDGTWNGSFDGDNDDSDTGTDPSPSPFDGGMFEDTIADTLADVAMYYYERDLHPSLLDGVPTTERDQNWAPIDAFQNEGEIMHQHMKTYTVGFGLRGTVNLEDLPLDYTQPFTWGDPFNQGLAKIDDMLHAAVNGRGEFLQANNPVLLSEAFAAAFEEFSDGSVSVSAVAFNSTALREETVEYRGFFNLRFNSGDLRALSVDPTDGTVDNANPIWRAAVQLDAVNPAARKIVTWDDEAGEGIVFDHALLNADQQSMLSEDELMWLRGERDNEEPNGTLRAREPVEGLLGDIVHSAPQFVGTPRAFRRDQSPYPTSDLYSDWAADQTDRARVVYVAANDGMLHGFDAGASVTDTGTGDEVFAYVPNKIIDPSEQYANDLDQLMSLVYSHRFFVDLTPSVEDVYSRAGRGSATKSWNTVLIGGLRGGGKGYFAVNVTDPDTSFSTASNMKDTIMWEFTDEDDFYPVDESGDPLTDSEGNTLLDLQGLPVKDLGYTFSQPQLVMTNAEDGSGNKLWMAIFGNGYNSTAGIAKLFALDINGGLDGWNADEVIKIDTGAGVKSAPDPLAGLPNGLGTPAVVDADGNGTADLAYAGDLFGNLYRFDLSDDNPDNWSVTRLFQATYDGTLATRQPFTTQPYVFAHPTAGFMVIAATGSYITEQDGTSTDIQSIYGIWDRGEDPAATDDPNAKFTRLVQQVTTNIIEETNAVFQRQRIVSGNEVAFEPDDNSGNAGVYGWYMDLDMVRPLTTQGGAPNPDTSGQAPPAAQYPGERAIRRFIVRGETILVSSVIPRDANTCFRSPPGAVWPLDALTGGNPRRAILDVNNDGVVDEGDLVNVDGVLYATGILFDQDDLDGTLVDPSLLVGRGDDDFLFLSGGDDQITLRIAGPQDSKTGRLSWRELDEAN